MKERAAAADLLDLVDALFRGGPLEEEEEIPA